MSKRAEYERAYAQGRAAEPGDRNPYVDEPVPSATSALWRRGYNTMLTERLYSTPMMQQYLAGRAANPVG